LSGGRDQVDALGGEREALWARIGAAEFLTVNEKRAAVGYGELEGGDDFEDLGSTYHSP
jgi:phage portal protein BeeE